MEAEKRDVRLTGLVEFQRCGLRSICPNKDAVEKRWEQWIRESILKLVEAILDGAVNCEGFGVHHLSQIEKSDRFNIRDAIAYPIERLSRTDRTVLKTAVTEVGSGCPCGREVTWS